MSFHHTEKIQAMMKLQEELKHFSYDGLLVLKEDLLEKKVLRGSWSGCVQSYARGEAGSTRRDSQGLAKNIFTLNWDSGWISEEEVIQVVDGELNTRGKRFQQKEERSYVSAN